MRAAFGCGRGLSVAGQCARLLVHWHYPARVREGRTGADRILPLGGRLRAPEQRSRSWIRTQLARSPATDGGTHGARVPAVKNRWQTPARREGRLRAADRGGHGPCGRRCRSIRVRPGLWPASPRPSPSSPRPPPAPAPTARASEGEWAGHAARAAELRRQLVAPPVTLDGRAVGGGVWRLLDEGLGERREGVVIARHCLELQHGRRRREEGASANARGGHCRAARRAIGTRHQGRCPFENTRPRYRPVGRVCCMHIYYKHHA